MPEESINDMTQSIDLTASNDNEESKIELKTK